MITWGYYNRGSKAQNYTYDFTFPSAYSSNNYSVVVTGISHKETSMDGGHAVYCTYNRNTTGVTISIYGPWDTAGWTSSKLNLIILGF